MSPPGKEINLTRNTTGVEFLFLLISYYTLPIARLINRRLWSW